MYVKAKQGREETLAGIFKDLIGKKKRKEKDKEKEKTQSVGIIHTLPKTALSHTGKQPEAKATESNTFRKNPLSNL